MKTVTLDVRSPAAAMGDFVRGWKTGKSQAVAELGRPEEIGRVFAGFQEYLYQQQAAA